MVNVGPVPSGRRSPTYRPASPQRAAKSSVTMRWAKWRFGRRRCSPDIGGDLAIRSADGYYTLRGRRGDLIISGGFNVYPREIEETLVEDSRVLEAAVVGVPDDLRGEIPIAYFVADDSVDTNDIEAMCRSKLASFKIPRAFIRVDALPRTALGKVQKHLLPPWSGAAQ
jgi:acyl-CoA synthetase (AMP-forming)/AMP-acid ligase II